MDKKFQSCTITDLAKLCGVEAVTFRSWLSDSDQIQMIRLGWKPILGQKKLPPSVVKYLRDKFIEGVNQPKQPITS